MVLFREHPHRSRDAGMTALLALLSEYILYRPYISYIGRFRKKHRIDI